MSRRFVIIAGAQRSGTTYLYRVLDAHPQIHMARPSRPEPKFFHLDSEYERGLDYYLERYFGAADPAQLWGEKSTSYLESGPAPERIAAALPEARILIMLRNPVVRALSNYHFTRQNSLETRTLEEALFSELPTPRLVRRISVSPFRYVPRGEYVRDVRRYLELFGARLRVLIYERFVSDDGAVSKLCEYLGVDPGAAPRVPTIDEESTGVDYAPSAALLSRLNAHYEEPNRELAELLGEDLSVWSARASTTR